MNSKNLLLLLVIILLCGLASCKKEKSSPVAGKWQETKIRIYEVDSTNKILYDTTYLHPFTSSDYILFNSNNTVDISIDHNYYLNSPGSPKTPQSITPVPFAMNYTTGGSGYILTLKDQLTNPGGFDVRDTVMLKSSNSLFFRSVFYSHLPGLKTITDSYYTK